MIKAVIFDLDDTLISEKQYIESGYQHISSLLSNRYKKDETELYNLLVNFSKESSINVFNRVLETLDISYTQENIKNLVEEYRSHKPQVNFFEDVIPCFEFLKNKEIKIGIITDGYKVAQRNKIEAIQAQLYVEKIIITDELGREYWKPHPKSFEIMKESLNVEFEEIVYIGDNPMKDFYISHKYPVKTIRIKRINGVYTNTEYYMNIKEDVEVTSLKEIEEVISIEFK